MDVRALRDLLAGGETFTVEFKAGSIDDSKLVEAVVCLANGRGGTLLIGVDDNGAVEGAAPRHDHETDPRRVKALVANRTDPAVLVDCTIIEIDGCEVVVIVVPVTDRVVATINGRYLRRSIDIHGQPQCLPMRPHEVVSRAGSIGAQDYTRVAIPALTIDDLSQVELKRFRDLARGGGDETILNLSNKELLMALGFLGMDGHLTVGALLLFGSRKSINDHLPALEIGFQELSGLDVRARSSGPVPLLRAMTEIVDRVHARNPEEEIDVGLLRIPLPRFADTTLRELIANALVHRDYTALGATVVEITEEALVVSNPGGFPEGVTMANLLTSPPRPRNPALADAFKRAGVVDRTGRGVNRAFVAQLKLGRPAPSYERSTPTSVVARVYAGLADKDLAGFVAEAGTRGEVLSLQDLLTLHEIRLNRLITTSRAAELFQVDPNEARAVLNRLADSGLVEARGDRKGRTYHMSAALYRRLGQSAQYVRVREFDDIQQEQMVLTFVERHGSITRAEAAGLCRIDSARASRLLRRLRDENKLQMVGKKRASRYLRPALSPPHPDGGSA